MNSLYELIKQKKKDNQIILVVLEAQEDMSTLLFSVYRKKVLLYMLQPNKVKAFAKARGRLAKTDKIDAKILKEYGSFNQLDEIKTLPTSRYNPKIKLFYMKLIASGKPPKVALVAVMRKMIVILNAMVQTKKHFSV